MTLWILYWAVAMGLSVWLSRKLQQLDGTHYGCAAGIACGILGALWPLTLLATLFALVIVVLYEWRTRPDP